MEQHEHQSDTIMTSCSQLRLVRTPQEIYEVGRDTAQLCLRLCSVIHLVSCSSREAHPHVAFFRNSAGVSIAVQFNLVLLSPFICPFCVHLCPTKLESAQKTHRQVDVANFLPESKTALIGLEAFEGAANHNVSGVPPVKAIWMISRRNCSAWWTKSSHHAWRTAL